MLKILITSLLLLSTKISMADIYAYSPRGMEREAWLEIIRNTDGTWAASSVNTLNKTYMAKSLDESSRDGLLRQYIDMGAKVTAVYFSNLSTMELKEDNESRLIQFEREYLRSTESADTGSYENIMPRLTAASTYKIARDAGADPITAFGYSTLISSLLVNPEQIKDLDFDEEYFKDQIINSIIGEGSLGLNRFVVSNNGKFMGSQGFGQAVLFITEPSENIKNSINQLSRRNLVETFKISVSQINAFEPEPNSYIVPEQVMGFRIHIVLSN